MMEAANTTETSVNFYQTARSNSLEYGHLQVLSMCGGKRLPTYWRDKCARNLSRDLQTMNLPRSDIRPLGPTLITCLYECLEGKNL
jgi:hypothetical protein